MREELVKKTITRDVGIDITRIIAFASVPAVHFFKNSEFYETAVIGERMYLMVILRTAFMVCVPLFLLLTGYLMSDKDIPMERDGIISFYVRIKTIIMVYVISTIIILVFQNVVLEYSNTFSQGVLNILGFKQYSWYVEMYIGLYLLIPFINMLWNKIDTNTNAKIMIAVLLCITVAPSIFNVYSFSEIDYLLCPWKTNSYDPIIPDWWQELYPITYYFLGAYIKRYIDIKAVSTKMCMLLLCSSLLIFGLYNIWRSYSIEFQWGSWCSWGSYQNTIDSVLVFLLINSIDYNGLGRMAKIVLKKVAGLSFAAYLLSWIPDQIFYPILISRVPKMQLRINYAPQTVLLIIIVSLILSAMVQIVIKGYNKTAIILKNKTSEQ